MITEKEILALGFVKNDNSGIWCEYYIENGTDKYLGLKLNKEIVTLCITDKYDWEGHDEIEFKINSLYQLQVLLNLVNYAF